MNIFIALLKNWKLVLIGLLVISVIAMGNRIDGLLEKNTEKKMEISKLELEVKTAVASLTSCFEDQKIAGEISNEYQTKLAAVERNHAAAIKRMRSGEAARCIPIIRPAQRLDASSQP